MPDVFIHNQRFYNPVDYVLQLIGGTWKVPVLWRLRKRSLRYTELEKDIPHISQKMLTKALKELEADGLVSKTTFAEVPPRVIYALTEKGVRELESRRSAWLRRTVSSRPPGRRHHRRGLRSSNQTTTG